MADRFYSYTKKKQKKNKEKKTRCELSGLSVVKIGTLEKKKKTARTKKV